MADQNSLELRLVDPTFVVKENIMIDPVFETILDIATPRVIPAWVQTISATENDMHVVVTPKDAYEGPYHTRAEVLQFLASYSMTNELRVTGVMADDVGSQVRLAIDRAGLHIARRTRRAKGNRVVQTPTGWMVFYARDPYPIDTGDGPVHQVGEDQYVLVPGISSPVDYFFHILDPNGIIAPVIDQIMEDSPGWTRHPLGGYTYA